MYAIRSYYVQRLDHLARQDIGTVRLAGVDLDRHLAADVVSDLRIDLEQAGGGELRREEDLRLVRWAGKVATDAGATADGQRAEGQGAGLDEIVV